MNIPEYENRAFQSSAKESGDRSQETESEPRMAGMERIKEDERRIDGQERFTRQDNDFICACGTSVKKA